MVEIGIAVVVVLAMAVVGLELTLADFTRVVRYPRPILAALLAQWVLVPSVVTLLVLALPVPEEAAVGMLLVALSPIGAMANFYALLSRGQMGIAVTMTAVSSLCAILSVPLVSGLVFRAALGEAWMLAVPAGDLMKQALLGLALPMGAGMALRALAPDLVRRIGPYAQGVALAGVLAVIGLVIASAADRLSLSYLVMLLALCALFTGVLLVTGLFLARVLMGDAAGRRALMFGFPARNYAFAMLLSVQVLGSTTFGLFGAIFFVVQCLALTGLALALKARGAVASA